MYSSEFCKIYDKYGWDYFSITMGNAIIEYLKAKNKKIEKHLDLGCGVGTLCDYFYKNKITTVGIDISEDMIDICKNKNTNINFLTYDITKYKSKESYDLITLTCDVVNHIITESKLENLFSNIYEMLNNSGYLIFDIYDQENLGLNHDIVSHRENGIDVWYYITQKDANINTNVKVKQNDKLIYEYDILERLYSKDYIEKVLEKYNFKIIKATNNILNEKQRFEDKIYFICQKK